MAMHNFDRNLQAKFWAVLPQSTSDYYEDKHEFLSVFFSETNFNNCVSKELPRKKLT